MSMVSFAAFPIMIGIGIDYAIQFHNRIDEELGRGESILKAAINTINHVALPVAVALTVTEAGFVSLLSSSVPSINDFGKVCIIGLIMCYLSALFVNVTILICQKEDCHEKRMPKDIRTVVRQSALLFRRLRASVSKDGRQFWPWPLSLP